MREVRLNLPEGTVAHAVPPEPGAIFPGSFDPLRTELRNRGADIVIAHGEAVEKLTKLHARVPINHVFAHKELGNDVTYRRDRAAAAWCRTRGVEYREFPQSSVRRGGVNRDRLQRMWQSRIVDVPPLPMPAVRQSDTLCQLAAATASRSCPRSLRAVFGSR